MRTTLTRAQTKCFLWPTLNSQIQQEITVQYTVLLVTDWRLLQDPATGTLVVLLREVHPAPVPDQPDSALSVHDEDDVVSVATYIRAI
jgi:hypothetical protein